MTRLILARKFTVAEAQSDFYHYFSTTLIDGFGIVKEIDVNNSIITLSSQISEDKTLKVNFNENSRFYQFLAWEENGNIKAEPIELKALKIDDKVYFACRPNPEGNFILLWLNVASKE